MGKLSMELYLEKIRAKYKKANKREKDSILNVCKHSGYHKNMPSGLRIPEDLITSTTHAADYLLKGFSL